MSYSWYLYDAIKFVRVAQHFQQTRIGFRMSKFAFGKRATQSIEFGFGKVMIQIAPKGFYLNFYLCYGEQTSFYNFLLYGRQMRTKILNVCSKIYFRMHPKRTVDGLGKF